MSTEDGNRIRITEEDTQSSSVQERVEQMEQAQRVALVRTVGDVPKSSGSGGLRAILTLTAGGTVGGVVAFLVQKLADVVPFISTALADNVFLSNIAFTFILAVFIGAGVSLADVTMNGSWSKLGRVAAIALPAAIGSALVLGVVAHFFYERAQEWLFNSAYDQLLTGELTDSTVDAFIMLRMHPIRGLAWLLVGVSAGIAAGAAARSWKRLGLAAIGGAIGGFVGGFVFDFIAQSDNTEWVAQAIGIVVLGTLIGVSTGLIEQVGKSRWIEIVSGGLAGKQFILYKSEIAIGSSPSADITIIKDSRIPPVAAVMRIQGQRCTITEAAGASGMEVNNTPFQSTELRDMDVVSFGNTQIRFREKASSGKSPGALHR